MIFLLFRVVDEFYFHLSDTSLNEPEKLNHWADQHFPTWIEAVTSFILFI